MMRYRVQTAVLVENDEHVPEGMSLEDIQGFITTWLALVYEQVGGENNLHVSMSHIVEEVDSSAEDE